MNFISYAQSIHELGLLKELGVKEVILSSSLLSKTGELNLEELIKLSNQAKILSMRRVLDWDLILTNDKFTFQSSEILKLQSNFDAIRVHDLGAFHFCFEKLNLPIQLVLEHGHHNLLGLKKFETYMPKLERLILSIEIPRLSLQKYFETLSIPCEILGLGPILLFYSPRKLLSPLKDNNKSDTLYYSAESEESPHKGFEVIENTHGTYMYHLKDFCLLNFRDELKLWGLKFFRIDVRRRSKADTLKKLALYFSNQLSFDEFKHSYPYELMHGFYKVNKTDILFPKLKNQLLSRNDKDYLGCVIEAKKDEYLILKLASGKKISLRQEVMFCHPEGKTKLVKLNSLKNLSDESIQEVTGEIILKTDYIPGVVTKSIFKLNVGIETHF